MVTEKDKNKAFLKSSGILPTNILHINPNKEKAAVLWYTKAQQRQMYFVDSLDLPCGKAQVPAMVWLASKSNLTVFALANDRRPTEKTPLHYAPFFNIYEKGNVCMGKITIDITNSASVSHYLVLDRVLFFQISDQRKEAKGSRLASVGFHLIVR